MGGLGNQMFQYAAGRALSTHYGTKLFLDTGWFLCAAASRPGAERSFMLDKFNIQARIVNKKWGYKVYEHENDILLIKLDLFKLKTFTLFSEKVNMPFQDKIFMNENKNIYLDGYWQTEKYFKGISNEIRKEFSLRKPLKEQDEIIVHEIRDANSVSIHIRRGDYANYGHTKKFHGIIPIQHYKKCVTYFLETIKNPIFYIFSDDPEWCMDNLDLKINKKIISNSERSPQEDMILMSGCKHHIIANSSFSWWAAWLNANQSKIVIAPKQWVSSSNENFADIIPESWLKF